MPESDEIILENGSLLIYSGTCHKKEHGVGLMISKKLKNSLISFIPFSDRILSARFYSSQVNVTFIVAYAPTELAEKKEKDNFTTACYYYIQVFLKMTSVYFLGTSMLILVTILMHGLVSSANTHSTHHPMTTAYVF